MKFDIFSPQTWGFEGNTACHSGCVCQNKKAIGRAMGNIGNFMHWLARLENSLRDVAKNEEYSVALSLQDRNPKAFEDMKISFVFPDNEVAEIFRIIYQIKETWSKREDREARCESILHSIQQLKPFFQNHYYKNTLDLNQEYIENFKKIKIKGNAAWEVYFKEVSQHKYWHEAWRSTKEKLDKFIGEGEDVEEDESDRFGD